MKSLKFLLSMPEARRRRLTMLAGALITFALLACCTAGLLGLRVLTGANRPYTIFYLIPVAVGAGFLGVRGGILIALLAVLLARIFLFDTLPHDWNPLTRNALAEDVEFLALAAGTLTIAIVTGRLRSALSQLRHASEQLQESEAQRRAFNRDVLLAVTGGKLRLIEPGEPPPAEMQDGTPLLTIPLRSSTDAATLRHSLQPLAAESGLSRERIDDLCTAATEAATNALKHGSGGQARVRQTEDALLVEVTDNGAGITPAHLARATLEQGYSTRVSLGMGFHLMLQTVDCLGLSTGPAGTTVLLQFFRRPRADDSELLLSRYAAI